MDSHHPELNDAETPEGNGHVADRTSEAGGETDSSDNRVQTESPIEETRTSEMERNSPALAAPTRFTAVIQQELGKLLYGMTQLSHKHFISWFVELLISSLIVICAFSLVFTYLICVGLPH